MADSGASRELTRESTGVGDRHARALGHALAGQRGGFLPVILMAEDLSEKLRKFKLSDKEKNGLSIAEEDVAHGFQECQLSLIGKIYGEKKANINGLKTTLHNIWFTKEQFFIKNIGFNLYQSTFQLAEDKEQILQGKTWTFDGQYILLKDWNTGALEFSSAEEKIRIWVQLHNLPLHWLTIELGTKIGQVIGKVIDVLVPGVESMNEHIMKVQVEMNLREAIPRGTLITLGSNKRWVDFRYENLQAFSFYCGLIGHVDKNCSSKKGDFARNMLSLGQFGEWLRVGSVSFLGANSSRFSGSEGLSADDSLKLASRELSVGERSLGKYNNSPVSTPPLGDQESGSNVGGLTEVLGNSTKETSIPTNKGTLDPSSPPFPIEEGSDQELVEVAIQPLQAGSRAPLKRRKVWPRVNKSGTASTLSAMEVDKGKLVALESGSVLNFRKRYFDMNSQRKRGIKSDPTLPQNTPLSSLEADIRGMNGQLLLANLTDKRGRRCKTEKEIVMVLEQYYQQLFTSSTSGSLWNRCTWSGGAATERCSGGRSLLGDGGSRVGTTVVMACAKRRSPEMVIAGLSPEMMVGTEYF
ncbi:Unknown protein [Striga hermonthica]|uniref:DUF4283 domain-containing protein n=1 Tax=Striga hermonthica TaxID=68872 RepID=A0A9N7RFQ7_STRHE|nr:Unknown protein [Striga hermonthica]